MALRDERGIGYPEEKPEPCSGMSERNLQRPERCGCQADPTAIGKLHNPASLMEAVLERGNMMKALKRVVGNKGSAGIDGMRIDQLKSYVKQHWPEIKNALMEGKYRPQPVKEVEIPKPGGKGVRKLGIPTVLDRLIQQAIQQTLTPIFEADFSDYSYGFRPGRSTHQAILKAQEYVKRGKEWVVDLDLEKFFDRVNHDILMSRIARKVKDKRLLKLIRRYLQAGAMIGGLETVREEGTPQGGPLSPLLSNIILNDLDKELEKREHTFCRYADDCNIYVQSEEAGKRVMTSIKNFLEKKLKLKVNEEKSAVARPWDRKILGYTITKEHKLEVAETAKDRFKKKIRDKFRKGRGKNLKKFIEEIKPILRGWNNYYRLTEVEGTIGSLDAWIRRKLRGILWDQKKHAKGREEMLMERGIDKRRARRCANNGRATWLNAGSRHMNIAFPNKFFKQMGLVIMLDERKGVTA